MSEDTTVISEAEKNEASTSIEGSSAQKPQISMKKQKKKKEKALQQFLAKPEGEAIEVPSQKAQSQAVSDPKITYESNGNCKICGQLSQKQKQCQFCKEIVCLQHIRKKRKFKNTTKFVRICDDCEDKFIYDKYMILQNKAEEALAMQEMIIQTKRSQLAELVAAKHTRIQLLHNKRKDLDQEKKENDSKMKIAENQYASKLRKFEAKSSQNLQRQIQVKQLQDSLPRPLDDDYNKLVQQNSKITKELVKYQKMCSQALKAKSAREKQLYDAYYRWQQKEQVRAKAKKKQECLIY